MLNIYYSLKPFIPRTLQITLRRAIASRKRSRHLHTWPIDEKACAPPDNWPGWPEGKKFAFVLTHDVETRKGQDKCERLMELEEDLGFRSSFNFVPKRYDVSAELRLRLFQLGFEVGVHGLHHDGKLYRSREIFLDRAAQINRYLKEWNSVGFRSPSMHHNLDWILDLDVEYDSSTFDTDPFEPQTDGIGKIFPFRVTSVARPKGYVELPYTLAQDFTLFILLKEKSIDIWTRKLDWIASKGGMALLNTHPDYMNFGRQKITKEEYPAVFYERFLRHVNETYHDQYWHALPREVAAHYRDSFKLKS